MELTPVLHTSDLSIGYGHGRDARTILSGINLSLYSGEMVLLLGANGIGKSTLLRTISGIQPPTSGTVNLLGHPLSSYSAGQLSKLISIVYTDRTLAGALTVEELVGLGRHPHTGFFGRMGANDRRIVRQAMESTGIIHKAGSYTADLSDGERQKAMIAKAIAQESPVIILDEPTAFLDAASRLDILAMLKTLTSEHGRSILLSTHDTGSTLPLADRLWVIRADHSAIEGKPSDLQSNGSLDNIFSSKEIYFDKDRGDFALRGQ